ncbi:50S ribosomal protein L11 methyltransferase [Alcaligenaceae bacterium LF4-65]|jgi:ribosomal protein L11 methyltransferase|uniref:Ribosomal protein L11 methyltransferase n=1 Tax=Zwartia hollandica TaxID=324606 RepID=A0A953T1L1_9BURK|nr:50S ribosomal protein L11 methyltransferase [Zwartia hollandica]MBZ1350418.1 50S ribosomal protein L11 methyltransferase [Zwartia hollandica]
MRELVLLCPGPLAEPLSDALLEAGALSVSVEDADLDTEDEQPLFGEPGSEPNTQAWVRNRLIVLLADGTDPAQLLLMARQDLDSTTELPWHLRDVPDADWVRLTQSQFGPIQVGAHILIVPSWHADQMPAKTEAGCIAIQLDPGLAFGTGSHPTTHLCLEWLAKELPRTATVLDYGCGSGILAIAAAMLGSGPVTGVDIDDQAVQATHDNALANRVTIQAMLPDGLAEGQFDVVVANILSNPLKVLAPMLSGRVCSGGSLVLSGVLERQAQEVAQAYAPWLPLTVWQARDGWVCLAGTKP